MRVVCTQMVLGKTIEILRCGGQRGEERVALWLAKAVAREPAHVVEVYEPDQITEVDYFRLPPESMRALMQHLGATRRKIVAQVHSHPKHAYHSDRDAEWAIIRHTGALSLVIPEFASTTTVSNFLDQAKTYELSASGGWDLRPNDGPDASIEVTA